MLKRGGWILGGIDSGRIAYRCLKGGHVMGGIGRFLQRRIKIFKMGYILRGRGRFWECRI